MSKVAFKAEYVRTVLVLDDSPLVLLTLAESLRDEGLTVSEAISAKEALAMLRAAPTAPILVTDVDLGEGLNGIDVARTARELFSDIPIIFMTGRPSSVAGQKLDDHMRLLWKPFLPSHLAAIIREVAR